MPGVLKHFFPEAGFKGTWLPPYAGRPFPESLGTRTDLSHSASLISSKLSEEPVPVRDGFGGGFVGIGVSRGFITRDLEGFVGFLGGYGFIEIGCGASSNSLRPGLKKTTNIIFYRKIH